MPITSWMRSHLTAARNKQKLSCVMDERQLTNTKDKTMNEHGWEIGLQTNPVP